MRKQSNSEQAKTEATNGKELNQKVQATFGMTLMDRCGNDEWLI